jgi:hypothetical protein
MNENLTQEVEVDHNWLIDFIVADLSFGQRVKLYKKMKKFGNLFANRNEAERSEDFQGAVAALAALTEHFNPSCELDYSAKVLAGRLANGGELDQGTIIHAVPREDITALCGATYGPRSAGWVNPYGDNPVNCTKCLQRIKILEAIG